MRTVSGSIAAAALLLSCTDRLPGDQGSASATESSSGLTSSATSSASVSASASTGTTSVSTGPGSASTADPTGGRCPGLAGDMEGEPAVEVRIVNARDRDVFLVDTCVGSYFAVDGDGGTWPARDCETCAWALTNGCGCPKFCIVKTLRIAPGGRFTAPWNGILLAAQAIPAGCGPECTTSCMLGAQAPAGPYTVAVRELTAEVCESGGCGTCTPNSDGWCETDSSVESPGTPVGKTFAYPRETVVELVLE